MPDGGTLPFRAAQDMLVYRRSPLVPVSQPGTKNKTFVLSNEKLDRHGTVLKQSGWMLDNFRANPIALFGHKHSQIIGKWNDIRVENNQLVAEFSPAKRGTSRLADEINGLIEQDIIRATSVGFLIVDDPVQIDPKDRTRGFLLPRNELLEASIVGVGSNPHALAQARSMGISEETVSTVFGGYSAIRRPDIAPGGHAEHQSPTRKAISMSTISQRVQAANEALVTARDAYHNFVQEDDYDIDNARALKDEMETRQARLGSLQEVERSLGVETQLAERGGGTSHASNATGTQASTAIGTAVAVHGARRPLGVGKREMKPGDALVRAAVVHMTSFVTRRTIEDILRERYPDETVIEQLSRAAVPGANTTTAGWAAELVQEQVAEFMSNLDPMAIFPRLAAQGTPLMFGPNAGTIRIPSRATTPSIGGSFVREGNPIPVRRLGLTSIPLLPHKIGVISYFSREIARYSNPAIEGIIREGMRDDTAIMIDGLLLDAIAGDATRPAGLAFGVAAQTASTDGGFAAILSDIKTLTAPFYAVNAGRKLVMLVNPAQSLELMMAPGPDGTFGWTAQFASRFSLLESTNVPTGNVYMIDAADFVSVNGTPEFDISEQATIHAEDTTPLNIGTAGTPATVAAPTLSMFQTANIAIRMIVDLTWAMRRTGMVQWMTGVDWSPAAP